MRTLILLLIFASTASAADLPKYWSVHIDNVKSSDRDEYEQAGREQAVIRRQILSDHKIDRPPAFAIRTTSGTYLSFRPRENFAAFDDALPPNVRQELNEKAGAIEDRVHASLVAHHSEIWETSVDMSAVPGNATRARGYARLATMRVKPTSFEDFEAVMKRFAEALRKTHPNDVALTFFSTYGDGSFKQLWLSDEQIVGMRDVFKDAFGEEAADGLMKQWKSAVQTVNIVAARPRPDLTATNPENWLQY